MSNLSNIGTIKDILNRHGFSFSKALGQNFLVNPSVCPKMAEMGGARPNAGVIEIGAGIGVLTAELASRADKVVCIEIDNRLLPILDETLEDYDNIKIINEDVLKVNLEKLIHDEFGDMPVAICANLPYYITSPIIMGLLEAKLPIESITVMVQKEAAKRICAEPGTRETGSVSVAVRYYSEPEILFNVSRGSFMPSPDVDSTVIKLNVLKKPSVDVKDQSTFFKVVRAAFAQRRKTISNTLSSRLGIDKKLIISILEEANIKPTARAEQLTMEDFQNLANVAYDRLDQ